MEAPRDHARAQREALRSPAQRTALRLASSLDHVRPSRCRRSWRSARGDYAHIPIPTARALLRAGLLRESGTEEGVLICRLTCAGREAVAAMAGGR